MSIDFGGARRAADAVQSQLQLFAGQSGAATLARTTLFDTVWMLL
jgi:hypothetical protein